MIRLGITGGIGSGKSVLTRILKALGYPIYIADDRAKKLMVTDTQLMESLKSLLGEEVYKNGELNKPLLATYLFAAPENTVRINQIVHPCVKKDFEQWCRSHEDYPLVAFESAILFEAEFLDVVDYSVLVYAPKSLRIERAVFRDNSTVELIEKRIAAQACDDWKKTQVDYVIQNDHQVPLLPQVLELIGKLLENRNIDHF